MSRLDTDSQFAILGQQQAEAILGAMTEHEKERMRRETFDDWPKTVDRAVDKLLARVSTREKRVFKRIKKDDLGKYVSTIGWHIIEEFGLWKASERSFRNDALFASCGKMLPRDAATVITQGFWKRLQSTRLRPPPAVTKH